MFGGLLVNFGAAIALAIAGAACAAYGLKYVLSETMMRFHYFWFALAAILVAPAALMAAGLWDNIPIALHWAVAAALLVFMIFELAFGIAVGLHFNDTAVAGLDYVLALGAQVLDGKPGCTFSRRLDAACNYLAENTRTRCIICGGQGSNESVPEADAGRDYLVERGIDSSRILLEARSRSTAQNLRFATELFDLSHDAVGIVTDNYHLARALALARKAGMEHASGIAVKSPDRFPLNDVVRESFAWVKDILSGNA